MATPTLSPHPPAHSPSLWEAAEALDQRSARSRQTQLGASDTVCARRAAYITFGTTPSDQSPKRAAILGTYLHTGFLTAAREVFNWLTEKTVHNELVRGHIDTVQLDQATAERLPARLRPHRPADQLTVEDLKTKSTRVWDHVLREGATAAERRQVYLYAGLLRTEGFADVDGQHHLAPLGPLDVQRIRFRFINRDNGEEHVQELAYDHGQATEALWWVERIQCLPSPQWAPRGFAGPGIDAICDSCPFRSLCWPAAEPGRTPQSAQVHHDADREQALAQYAQGAELTRTGERLKKTARARLDGSPSGTYGPHRLAWTGGTPVREVDTGQLVDLYRRAGVHVPMRPDEVLMVDLAREAGLTIPQRTTDRRTPRTIKVLPAPEPPPTGPASGPQTSHSPTFLGPEADPATSATPQ
ncbi:PD-(D/E)XK nuclease family protein [Streptacidiphilus sp. EB129]|uniref:PD-(D/E)XK nuclease family protein n=1 Tax=Streptacidiphilus sp. EB129 TaxID=3156262 RepID=UPI00351618CA